MPITYHALDNEFAASSGSNVNVTERYSYFDNPPNSTSGLTITSNDGDLDPSLFEVGDVYDLEWSGHGAGSMDDAVVIRSDYLGPGEGAIVFEGVNSSTGELYQVVWTPGFDLESWYWDNGGGPSSPNGFWTSDMDDQTTVEYVCFVRGTRILTPHGMRRVENLKRGAQVSTRDRGTQTVRWSGSRTVLGRGRMAPVVFAPGAVGNVRSLALSQNHRVMLASPLAELYFGAPEVFVPAKALVNNTTVQLQQRREVSYHHLLLGTHEVLEAEGLPSESLLASAAFSGHEGPSANEVEMYPDLKHLDVPAAMQTARLDLTYREARFLACEMGIVHTGLPSVRQSTLIAA